MKKLLFLNGEYSHTVDIIRVYKQYDKDFRVHALFKQAKFPCRSKYIDFVHFLPTNQDIVRFVDDLNQQYDFDAIFPVGFPEVEIFSKEKANIQNLYVDSYDIVTKTISKIETLEIAEKLSIPTPRGLIIHSREEMKTLENSELKFPLFIKSSEEAVGKVRSVVKNYKKLFKLCDEVFNIGGKPLIQEYVREPYTYGIGVLAEKGKMQKYFMHKEILSFPPSGGSGIILSTFYDEQLLYYSKKLIDCLKYSGLALIEFKYSSKINDFVLMEINSKFWASIDLALTIMPDFLPFIEAKKNFSKQHIYLYPDRLISTFRYAPIRTIKYFIMFLFFKGKKTINFNFKDFKYELCKIFIASAVFVPKFLKEVIKKKVISNEKR